MPRVTGATLFATVEQHEEDPRSLHRPAQPVRVREVQRGHFHQAALLVTPCRSTVEGPHGDALVNETPRHVSAGVAEGPGDDGQAGSAILSDSCMKVGKRRLRYLWAAHLMFVPPSACGSRRGVR